MAALRACRAAGRVWQGCIFVGRCAADATVQLLRHSASSSIALPGERPLVTNAATAAAAEPTLPPLQPSAPSAGIDAASAAVGSGRWAPAEAASIAHNKQLLAAANYGPAVSDDDISSVGDGSSRGGGGGGGVRSPKERRPAAIAPSGGSRRKASKPQPTAEEAAAEAVASLSSDSGVQQPPKAKRPLQRPSTAVIAALGGTISRRTFVNIERGGRVISLEQRAMSEIVDLLTEQGADVGAFVSTPTLFSYPCADVRLAVSLLVLDDKPATPAAVVALLDGSGDGGGFLYGSGSAADAAYRSWRGVPAQTARRMLAAELGVAVSELDGMQPCRVHDAAALLDKVQLLRQQPEVEATPRDWCTHSSLLAYDIDRIAMAVVQLRKANVSPVTLMQVYIMACYGRITRSPSQRSVADRYAALADLFQCDAATIAAASQSLWPVHTVDVDDVHDRVQLLASMGVQPRDVLRVPHVLSFARADVEAAVAQVDALPAEKRDALRGDSFKLLNALLYFADKPNMFQLIRNPHGQHLKKRSQKKK